MHTDIIRQAILSQFVDEFVASAPREQNPGLRPHEKFIGDNLGIDTQQSNFLLGLIVLNL
jgi:hypothetical protein